MQVDTRQFGLVEYNDDAVVEFPHGLPAFETDTRFIVIEKPEIAPVIFLQSLIHPELCFLTLPIEAVDAHYRLEVPPEEARILTAGSDGAIASEDLLTLAIVTLREDGPPTANLMAPVVIYRKTRRGHQVIQPDATYSFEHPLIGSQEERC